MTWPAPAKESRFLNDQGDIVQMIGQRRRLLFAADALACPATGGLQLHPGFAEALWMLRLSVGRSFVVLDCCRSADCNARQGGHPRSLHIYDRPAHGALGACAIKITPGAPEFNTLLTDIALKQGWSIGFRPDVIHLDRRGALGLPTNVFALERGKL